MVLRSAWLSAEPAARLDLGGVGGEPAHHLAGMRRLVEGGAERGQMPEHLRAQVGDHALAQPVDRVHARGAGQRQHQADADQRDEVEVDEAAVVPGKADVDHAPHGDRHRQHGRGRDDQGHERQPPPWPGGARGRATAPAAGAPGGARGRRSAVWSASDNGRPCGAWASGARRVPGRAGEGKWACAPRAATGAGRTVAAAACLAPASSSMRGPRNPRLPARRWRDDGRDNPDQRDANEEDRGLPPRLSPASRW